MKRFSAVLIIGLNLIAHSSIAQVSKAPAYALITHNPYFSIWSFSDNLNESTTKHWTGSNQSIVGLIKVDNQVYKFLGKDEFTAEKDKIKTAEIVRMTIPKRLLNFFSSIIMFKSSSIFFFQEINFITKFYR